MSNPQCFTSCFNISHCIGYRFRNMVISTIENAQQSLKLQAMIQPLKVSMGIIDIELYHMSRGKMENPKKLRNYDQPCGFSWDYHRKNYTTATQDCSWTLNPPLSSRIEGYWDSELNIERKCSVTFFVDILKVIVLSFRWWLWSWCYLGNWIDIYYNG